MADELYKMVTDFIDEQFEMIARTMYVLNGGKDEIDSNDVIQFLKDCLTEGLAINVTRAIQICEMKIKEETEEKESADDEDA